MKSFVCQVLGENIKRIRKAKGLNQSNLAELMGMEIKSLSLIETGNGFASAKTLEKLSSVLDVSLSELFETSNQNNSEFLYENILKNLQLIKNNSIKLNTINMVLKNII